MVFAVSGLSFLAFEGENFSSASTFVTRCIMSLLRFVAGMGGQPPQSVRDASANSQMMGAVPFLLSVPLGGSRSGSSPNL